MIRIISKRDGFRRCGIAHSKRPVEYDDKRFSKKELAILQAETMLVVEVIFDDKEARAKAKAEAEAKAKA